MVTISDDQQEVVLSTETERLQQVLGGLRDELDDHRESINETTTEVASVYEFMDELDTKLSKVQAMVEELFLVVKGAKKEEKIKPLSGREKSICRSIYVLGQTRAWVGYEDIANHLKTSKDALSSTIAAIVAKGVPILKKYDAGKAYVQFTAEFRQKQAKENVIRADCLLTNWIHQE